MKMEKWLIFNKLQAQNSINGQQKSVTLTGNKNLLDLPNHEPSFLQL